MKKLVLVIVLASSIATIQAQQIKSSKDSTKAKAPAYSAPKQATLAPKKDWSKVDLNRRPADHFVFQYGYDGWAGAPDSITTTGFGRHFNFYGMVDKPMKTDPHYSLAYGLGFGSSNIFFSNQIIHLEAASGTLPFTNVSGSDHYAKFKLTTIYAEIPAEIRIYEDPENKTKGWKGAIGLKAGLLLKGYTKGKNYENSANSSYYGSTYVNKVSDKHFLNGTKLAFTGRVGYGFISLHVDYNVLGVLKSGAGPTINPYSIGISIGGL
jgi:hypothetical protein